MKTNQTDKATARPWIQESNRRGKVCVTAVGVDDRDPLIAEMFDSDFTTLPEQEANAALIVEAVNERDALNAVALFADHKNGCGDGVGHCTCGLVIAQEALAAIREGKVQK